VELRVTDCPARLPFRFGAATITWAPLVTARVRAELEDGSTSTGYSADLMMPRWFDKDPAKTIVDDVTDLARSAQEAGRAFERAEATEVFELWRGVHRARIASGGVPLVAGFGVALIERALLDAVCRAAGCSFFEALRTDLFGFAPERVHHQLAEWNLAASLPTRPLARVKVRHTVGLADPLRVENVDRDHAPDDGLPVALEEDIDRYGLKYFKLKIGGDVTADRARLVEITRFLDEVCGPGFRFTLDANEQYANPGELRRLIDEVEGTDVGALFRRALLYVEQPLPRSCSFDRAAGEALRSLRTPVILDEADGGIDAFPVGLDVGYRGVSVKNCKGVFRALLNRGLCEVTEGAFQSAEDLTNLPVLSLQEDLATVAALGLPHVERNGHHYFRGLDHLPPGEANAAHVAHPDLYHERDGLLQLRIERGELDLGSLDCTGYGYNVPIDFEARTLLEDWTPRPPAAS